MPTDKPQVILDEQFITDADALYEAILTQTPWDDRMHARLTASYGAPYNYSNMSYPEVPMPTLFPALNQPPGISKRLSKAPDTPINFASHCF